MTRVVVDADVSLPAEPYQTKNGYWAMNSKALCGMVYVHRWLAEKCLGRPLPEGALVHHVNYDKTDNRRCNLVVCPDDAYHQLLHRRTDVLNAGGNPNTDRLCRGACKAVLPKTAFSPNPRHADGLHSECRACSNARRKTKKYNYWGPKTAQQQRDRRAAAKACK